MPSNFSDIGSYFRGDITQDSANEFKEETISTNLSPERSVVAMIHHLEWTVWNATPEMNDNGDNFGLQLTRKSKDDRINYADSDLIVTDSTDVRFPSGVTDYASSANIAPGQSRYTLEYATPVASHELYIGLFTSGFTNPLTVSYRVRYTLHKVAKGDFLTLLQNLLH